jgi:aspartate racemase
MYTSGSTGKPKGVMVEHRSIVRLVREPDYCTITPDDVFLQAAPVSFDAATFEIWGALLNGATLAILPPEATTLEQIGRAIREYGVTTLWLTAGLFHLMVEQRLEDLRPVRQLLAGGDVLSPKCVQTVLDKLPGCTLINGYGPTENTTFTCCHVMRPGERIGEAVPIGRPISGTTVYILDENLQPVDTGQTGELYTGGVGVARGYWNNPEATAEKFVPDPFARDGSKMYRTGDLARWNEDSCIEFLGRIDNQVKIRGHRIEPGEIEAVLETHPDLGQVCVAVDASEDDGSKRLIAFYTLRDRAATQPAASDLRDYLKLRLPQYMIPALFAAVERMPLSPNGKVDRAALLAVPRRQESGSPENPAPASNAEQVIYETWKRLLRTSQVGLDDNFFDLGGDSLLLVAVHANLERLLAIEIPVTALFEHTTVRSLARRLSEKDQDGPRFATAQSQAQKQREVFAKARMRRAGGV